jgi:hypothetical protein
MRIRLLEMVSETKDVSSIVTSASNHLCEQSRLCDDIVCRTVCQLEKHKGRLGNSPNESPHDLLERGCP